MKALRAVTQNDSPILKARRESYLVNEIFYSLQGEGVRAGSANTFIRLSGCNQSCKVESHGFDCDTEFVSGTKMSASEILDRVKQISGECRWVILTGGEPLLQLDHSLCSALKLAGYKLAIETNGSIDPAPEVLEALDWICCSPKVAEHAIRLPRCNEVKYVRAYGQGIPKPAIKQSEHKLISPAFSGDGLDPKTLNWCINLVKENPEWRLSVQQHKGWKIR